MKVEQLQTCTEKFMEAAVHLLPQLSSFSPPPQKEDILAILNNPNTSIWVAVDDAEDIIGMLTLAIFQTPTGIQAWIEDVVVDICSRGKGCGEMLTRTAIAHAKKQQAKAVNLTSRPERVAANHLYQKLGFSRVETNLYRFHLK
jgi:ribosomal protein S18 acetylase RimI-like enzyme